MERRDERQAHIPSANMLVLLWTDVLQIPLPIFVQSAAWWDSKAPPCRHSSNAVENSVSRPIPLPSLLFAVPSLAASRWDRHHKRRVVHELLLLSRACWFVQHREYHSVLFHEKIRGLYSSVTTFINDSLFSQTQQIMIISSSSFFLSWIWTQQKSPLSQASTIYLSLLLLLPPSHKDDRCCAERSCNTPWAAQQAQRLSNPRRWPKSPDTRWWPPNWKQ